MPREEVGGRGGGQQPVPPPQTATERCLPRGGLVPGPREQGGTGWESGRAAGSASQGGGAAAASLLPLLPLQACKAKDGERRGGDP